MYVAKRKMQDGRVIKCKLDLSFIEIAYYVQYQLHRAFLLVHEEVWRNVPERHYSPTLLSSSF